ncbi:MAG: hypothetical protein WC323_02760 [Patescibacteria group bacterium]
MDTPNKSDELPRPKVIQLILPSVALTDGAEKPTDKISSVALPQTLVRQLIAAGTNN